ncbi:MAG: c-type cytochrome [Phycisphaerales bacterium]|nr:c-type cytochrome [Phycisphaerales bacterium]
MERDPLLDHEYDGIREYDNPTPGWWHLIFLGTVVFGLFYVIFWDLNPSTPTMHERHASATVHHLQLKFAGIGELQPDAPTIVAFMHNEEYLPIGRAVFKANCVSCHGNDGQGLVGPNLTDDAWKNVKAIEDIATVVANGAAGGAMPAWGRRLHPNEVVLVSSYVATLRGSKPGMAKQAEGDVIGPWPAFTPEGE